MKPAIRRLPVLYDHSGRPIYRGETTAYRGAGPSRRAALWQATSASINTILQGNLGSLRARCRDMARKAPWVVAGIGAFVDSTIGTGVRPLFNIDDQELRKTLTDAWTFWALNESDADGLDSFYGQQALIVREQREAGECFVRFRDRQLQDGLSVPLQLQVLESEQCDESHSMTLANGRPIKLGIEFNPIGQRTAYWMWRNHPGDALFGQSANERVPVPAQNVIHFFETLRAGQVRGAPPLAAVVAAVKDLLDTDDSFRARIHVASLFAGFLRKPDEQSNPLGAGGDLGEDEDGIPLAKLEAGMFQELLPGEEVQFSTPPDVGDNFQDWYASQLRQIAMGGCEVTYEMMTGDLTKVNYSSIRAGNIWFRRSVQAFQANVIVRKLCQPVFDRWWTAAQLAGVAPAGMEKPPILWVPTPGWGYIDPTKEVASNRDRIRSGLATRSRIALEDGADPDQLDIDRQAEIAREKTMGLVYDTQPELIDGTGRKQQDPKAVAPAPGAA